ncbi:hypothetical protein AB4305_03620 [Nocardia sp. 2YAB30]|uniref:hypothetical protein n=1 Tax=unclassified Nocardia TaxID=2637762 RepID=UPI003F9961DE
MSGDPVEESSQAMRNGFVQALQTSHTTAALMRGRGGEARSKAESEQRLRHAAGKERRSFIEHRLRVIDAVESAGQARELNTAKVDEVRARIERSGELHELEQRQKNRQMERADADLDRRDNAGKLERKHKIRVHKLQVDGYTNREARAVALHELDVELKELLIDIRRRAAGFTDTLTTHGESGEAMASAAAFAAAKGAQGLSEQHDRDADAYAERFAEDTGTDYTEVIDATIIEDFGDLDDLDAGVGEQARSSVAIEDIVGLTEELSFATHLTHEFADLSEEAAAHSDEGSAIEESVDAAGLSGDGLTEAMDFAVDPDPPSVPMSPVPDPGIEP